jgi:6-phosphogluconolactonase
VVAERGRAAVAERGRFALALSGGETPWAMVAALAAEEMPWAETWLYQVDERAVPDGDPARNLTRLLEALPARPAGIVAMPVTGDLLQGAADYEALLPAALDLVHLGLGDDGHTASLVPGDPVLGVSDRAVGVTGVYRGHRRMTLTYPTLAAAAEALWLVTGAGKRRALAALLRRDPTVPAGRVHTPKQLVIADTAAAGRPRMAGATV